MIIAGHVKKIKGLSKKFVKKKFRAEFVVFFLYKMVFSEDIIDWQGKRACHLGSYQKCPGDTEVLQ